MLSPQDRLLGQVLAKHNLLSQEKLQDCWNTLEQHYQNGQQVRLGEVLIAKKYLTGEQVRILLEQIQRLQGQETASGFQETPVPPLRRSGQFRGTGGQPRARRQEVKIGELFAHYRIKKELGRGGMGAVYQVYDTKLERWVALKVILAGENISATQIERFLREARSTAQLNHPNIIDVYEVGDSPQNYFTMEYIEGEPFSKLIRTGKVAVREAVTILKKASEALHVAHEHGLIHRDIKPSNIMITAKGEPKIMDFGLVKIEQGEGEEKLSRTGGMMGTPAYMPPEQADGKEVDRRSDVYSLGATLYEALTGRPVFQGESYLNILRQVYTDEPIAPSLLNPDIDRELGAICLKCLEKKPEKRYQSAKSLARDLGNFLENKPIRAKPSTPYTRLRKWVLRNKSTATVALAAFLVIVISVTIFIVQIQQEKDKALEALNLARQEKKKALQAKKFAEAKRQEAEIQKQRVEEEKQKALAAMELAESAKQRAVSSAYLANIVLADRYVKDHDLVSAYAALELPTEEERRLKNWEWYWVRKEGHFEDYSWPVSADSRKFCRFRPYSRQAAVVVDFEVLLLDITTGEMQGKLQGHTGRIKGCDFSEDGKFLVTGGADKTLFVWDVDNQRIVRKMECPQEITCCCFTPDGRRVVSTHRVQDQSGGKRSAYEAIIVWDLVSGKAIHRLVPYTDHDWYNDVLCCAVSDGGQYLVTSGQQGKVRVWDLESGNKLAELKGHNNHINACDISPDGKWVISGGDDNIVRIWDWRNEKAVKVFRQHREDLLSCRFSPDGNWAISVSKDYNLAVWDIRKLELHAILTGHLGELQDCDIARDSQTLMTTSLDGTVKIWNRDARSNKNPSTLAQESSYIYRFAFSPDQKYVASGVKYFLGMKLWDFQRREEAKRPTLPGGRDPFLGHLASVNDCAFSADGKRVASSCFDKTVIIWDVESGEKLQVLAGHGDAVHSCQFTSDGKYLVSSSSDGSVIIWETNSGKIVRRLRHPDKLLFANLSPDDSKIAATLSNGQVHIWSFAGERLLIFKGHGTAEVKHCSFSPDGSKIVSCSSVYGKKHDLILWDANTGKMYVTYRGHTNDVNSCSFHPNGERIVSGASDHTIKIWDATLPKGDTPEQRSAILTLQEHKGRVNHVAFSPDGRYLLSSGYDGALKVWDAGKEALR